jgi:hypothetical protein
MPDSTAYLERVSRLTATLVTAAALLTGCGQGSPSSGSGGTLDTLLKRPGAEVPVIAGAADFQPGVVRFPFLVLRNDLRPVDKATARVWLATGRGRTPFARTTARLESIGVPGKPAATARIYVAHLPIPRPGRYWLVAEPAGGRIQALGSFDVAAHSTSPAVGAQAPRSDTPTLASTGGDAARLTTRRPPDLGLLRYSVAASLDAHRPFVVTFVSPAYCDSRTCGPVVDVVDAVRRRFSASGVRFIHVEAYRDNDPHKGFNRWMRQWSLPSQPWTFLVGSDGRVTAKFEGALSEAELVAAVRRTLL